MTTAEEADALNPQALTPGNDAPASSPDSPGQQLRQAREARKLDTSQVATSLRLAPRAIAAIEQDDYAQLPSPVFIAGYIRSYAKLVGLDPEPLVERFRQLHPKAESPAPHITSNQHKASERKASERKASELKENELEEGEHEGGGLAVFLITVLVILAVAAGGYGWWVSRPGQGLNAPEQATMAPEPNEDLDLELDRQADQEPGPTTTAAPTADEAATQPPTSSSERQPTARIETRINPAAASLPATPGSAGQTAAQTDTDGPASEQVRPARTSAFNQLDRSAPEATTEPTTASPEDLATDTTMAVASQPPGIASPLPRPPSLAEERPRLTRTTPESAAATAESAAATTATRPDNAPETTTDADIDEPAEAAVVLNFSGPCWVDIRDSTGKVLLFGEMARDDREILGGQPPYTLVLGNTAAAELSVAGQPYDLSAVSRGNVARFKLDPAEIIAQNTDASASETSNAGAGETTND